MTKNGDATIYMNAAFSTETADRTAEVLNTMLLRMVSDLNKLDTQVADNLGPLTEAAERCRNVIAEAAESEAFSLKKLGSALRSAQTGNPDDLREMTKTFVA